MPGGGMCVGVKVREWEWKVRGKAGIGSELNKKRKDRRGEPGK